MRTNPFHNQFHLVISAFYCVLLSLSFDKIFRLLDRKDGRIVNEIGFALVEFGVNLFISSETKMFALGSNLLVSDFGFFVIKIEVFAFIEVEKMLYKNVF